MHQSHWPERLDYINGLITLRYTSFTEHTLTFNQIVDQCPECPPHSLDLFQNSFGKIDDPQKGIIQLSWEFVDCPLNGLIYFRMKEGVSANWFSVQAVNASKVCRSIS